MGNEEKIYVIGHKNPDTDSICAAISLAYLKNKANNTKRYHARRAGQVNEETEFALEYFGVEQPKYMPNVGTQVKNMQIEEVEGAPDDITVRIAWEFMQESGISSLPVMDKENCLEGILSVTDITQYFMDSYTKTILADAKTKYFDIAETLNGHVLVGDPEAQFTDGRVIVAAASSTRFLEYLEKGDLVILSDRTDMQIAALENGAKALVITLSSDVSPAVRAFAAATGAVLIATTFDTYTAVRLINQAIPVKYLMRKEGLVSFKLEDFTDDIREVMAKHRYRAYPVLNHQGQYVGMIGSQSLINMNRKKIILVDHTERSQAVDNLEQAEILEIVDHHRIGTVETISPVYFRGEPVGCTCTILYSMYHELDIDIPRPIAGLMMSAIISDTLLFRSPTCTERDRVAGKALAKIAGVDIAEYAKEMFRAASALGSKTPDEILHQDFKKFVFGETVFGVGQISSMDPDELKDIAEKLRPQLPVEAAKSGMSMVFFMLTNIIDEETTLLCYGKNAANLLLESYNTELTGDNKDIAVLPKVVSRKKQLIPAFMNALQ
ncbi:MAG: putative manganese-dependent inorganic diphosphatase [Lachnospiraceae bacterium]|nr:putative manganese-dependent inorganic diphosphatase [Lachnospiraceae bacterium]